jgi:hypothetical protein
MRNAWLVCQYWGAGRLLGFHLCDATEALASRQSPFTWVIAPSRIRAQGEQIRHEDGLFPNPLKD